LHIPDHAARLSLTEQSKHSEREHRLESIATLTDLDPQRDLAATLEQTVVAAKQLFEVDATGSMVWQVTSSVGCLP
jgi:hypothetical protein